LIRFKYFYSLLLNMAKLGSISNGWQAFVALVGSLLIGLGIVNAGTHFVTNSLAGTVIMFVLGVIILAVKELISEGYTPGKIGLSDKAQAWIVFGSFILIAIGGVSVPAGLGTDVAIILVLVGSLGLAFKEWATGSIAISDLGLTDEQQSFLVLLSSLLVGIGGMMSATNVGGNLWYGLIVSIIGAIGLGMKEFFGTYEAQPAQKS
jgi:hypothetical protein